LAGAPIFCDFFDYLEVEVGVAYVTYVTYAPSQILRVLDYLEVEVGVAYVTYVTCAPSQILRVLDYLEVEVGVASADLSKVLRAFPAILRLDVDEDMRPVVKFLRFFF
jgi:hypothetical protein